MSRRLPSPLASQMKCCTLFTSGQRCATCPSKNKNGCPLPDIEDCLLPRQLAPQAGRMQAQLQVGCSVKRYEVDQPKTSTRFPMKADTDITASKQENQAPQKRPRPITPGCMRILASLPSATRNISSRGIKIMGPQKAPGMSVRGVPAEEPLVTADPFDVFRALRKVRDQKVEPVMLSSSTGKALFQEAMSQGTMETYFNLAQNHETQSEGAHSSFSCMAMILNAIGHDPMRTWKGIWRWSTAEVLQSENLLDTNDEVDISDFAAMARCKGAKADAIPCDKNSSIGLDFFREQVKTFCESVSASSHIVAHFDRKAIGQHGSGHFSALGGYHAEKDMVLILDVDRKCSPPYWVELQGLYNAMIGKGYVTVASARNEESAALALCPLHIASWAEAPLQGEGRGLASARAAQASARTIRRRAWRHGGSRCGRTGEWASCHAAVSGLLLGEASGALHGALGRSLDLLAMALVAQKRNTLRMASEYARD